MNRRDVFRLMGAAGLAAAGVRPLVANAQPKTVPWPIMSDGERVCLTCDKTLFLPHRVSPGHVSTWFINNHERRTTNVLLHGEKEPYAYEVLDGYWAIVAHRNNNRNIQLCPECGHNMWLEFREGPYTVQRTERFDPLLAGLVGDNAQW
jgi:hypothetical protein